MEKRLDLDLLEQFSAYLQQEEKSNATCEKYLRDVKRFFHFVAGAPITKEVVICYKQRCMEEGYAVRSINSMLASLNSLFSFLGWHDCKVKNLRLQRQTYCAEEKELTKADYLKLLEASKGDHQMNLILQTMGSTGIRVSELRFFTVEAVRAGEISVYCKSKIRSILIPGKLKRLLLDYARKNKVVSGSIFVNKKGKALDRSCIWRKMKGLCRIAGVNSEKVFPHNLRKLFARTFYSVEKDIAKLADLLGHSSINTTRIYIITTGMEHRQKIERLGLLI